MHPRRPNLFLVGAPRCGTTALHAHLAAHPDVYMSPIKELHYFSGDVYLPAPQATIATEFEYLRMFEGAAGEQWVGEASPYYLYSEAAVSAIRSFSPDARIVITVRNPADMMYSMHALRVRASLYHTRQEPIADFAGALATEPARLRGEGLPPGVPTQPGRALYLCYREMATYADHVGRWQAAFGRGAVHVVVFDDLRADLAGTYRQLCAFLGVDETFAPDFTLSPEARAAGARPRVRFLARMLWRPGSHLRVGVRAVVPPAMRRRLRNTLQRWNDRPVPPMSAETRGRILEACREDIQRLGAAIGRDLGPWLEDRPWSAT